MLRALCLVLVAAPLFVVSPLLGVAALGLAVVAVAPRLLSGVLGLMAIGCEAVADGISDAGRGIKRTQNRAIEARSLLLEAAGQNWAAEAVAARRRAEDAGVEAGPASTRKSAAAAAAVAS